MKERIDKLEQKYMDWRNHGTKAFEKATSDELPVLTRKADEEAVKLRARIAELESENALLKAENENWRKHGTSLNEIKAHAIEAAIKECGCNDDDSICFVRDLREFAEKLRGEK